MSESSTTTTANPATKTKTRNQRRRNNNRNKKPTTESYTQNNTDTTTDKDKKGERNPSTRIRRNKPFKTNTSSETPLDFSPNKDNITTTATNTTNTTTNSSSNRKKNNTYNAELKKLNTLQTAELELVKARLGAKNFTLYKSSKEQKTFAVTSVVSVNKRQQRVRFTVSVPREYPNTPVKLGTLLTPEYSPMSTNTSTTTTTTTTTTTNNNNTEIAVTEQQWKSNTVKNFNNECKQLLLNQNQPLIQQLNNFIVNFIEMSNKRPNEFTATRELKKQLLQEMVSY